MINKKPLSILLIFICVLLIFSSAGIYKVNADELSDSIKEQLEQIDLNELESLFDSLSNGSTKSFNELLNDILTGKSQTDFNSFFSYILNYFFSNAKSLLPYVLGVISLSIISMIVKRLKGNFQSEGIADVVFFVCILGVLLLLGKEIITQYINTRNTINTIAKIVQIMSPIILTLMVASGSTSSVALYKPAVTFLSSGIINIVLDVILPLIGVIGILSIVSCFSKTIKLNRLCETANSIIKWILGLTTTIFGLFVTIQGISSACYDGISIRAAKYAITNSIPLVGSMFKDGFDLVIAGSVLIKNAIGILSLFIMLFVIFSPISYMIIFSFLLKFAGGLSETFSDIRISDVCFSISKTLSYLITSILIVGFMVFITILLMILSANAFL